MLTLVVWFADGCVGIHALSLRRPIHKVEMCADSIFDSSNGQRTGRLILILGVVVGALGTSC